MKYLRFTFFKLKPLRYSASTTVDVKPLLTKCFIFFYFVVSHNSPPQAPVGIRIS